MIWICSTSNFIGGFSIIPTPGHTMGSVSILYQKNGILYSGDLTITMFEETSQNDFTSELVLYTLLSRPSELLEIQESSLNYLNSSLQTYSGIYPGHNGPYKGQEMMMTIIGATIQVINEPPTLP